MKKLTKTLIGIGAVGVIATAGVAVVPESPEIIYEDLIAECPSHEVSLDTKYGSKNVGQVELPFVAERLCMDMYVYETIKKTLIENYEDQSKDYDFDINHRELLIPVLLKEAAEQNKGHILLSGDKEKIINLLK